MAVFITFEGGEGSGKSLQARTLYRRLLRAGTAAVVAHEPGGTPLGRRISGLLKYGRALEVSPLSELLMFNASRAQLVRDVIRPSLAEGKVVLCDRYADSTVAYQGYGRGLALEVVRAVNRIATEGLSPDLTVLLDLAVEEGFARKARRGQDRFERERADFHRRVRQGYLKLAAEEPDRWLVIDASQSKRAIADIIWQRVSALLGDEQE